MQQADLIVIGAGAAGLTAAIFAAGRGARVTLLERTPQAGRKILMSGGTRCNVLPVTMSDRDFVTGSSRNRMRNIFKSWSLDRCREWMQLDLGLQLSCEEETNKWFPRSNSAREVHDRLVARAVALGADIRLNAPVGAIQSRERHWQVQTDDGDTLEAPAVIIATGGMSIPKTGTDGTGHAIVQRLGHRLHTPFPALTPLKGPHPGSEPLPGVSLDVLLRTEPEHMQPFRTRRTGFLFTHQGYSGPSILDVSHLFVQPEDSTAEQVELRVNWTGRPAEWWQKQLAGKYDATTLLRRHLPRRLADNLLEDSQLAGKKTAQLNRQERRRLIADLTNYRLPVTGHHGFRKAEVTGGGVPLDEVNPADMASRIAPGLFLCGEIMDVFGRIGGFNFYWAWVTGRLSGCAAADFIHRRSESIHESGISP